MDTAVISGKLSELLKNRKVKAAVFTTYTFNLSFFELEVIPLLLNLNSDTLYSTDEGRRRQVGRELQKEKTQTLLPLEVFYDVKQFRKQDHRYQQKSPRMEYLCHGVDLRNRAFHAKVAFILVCDKEWESDCLLVGAGSNNLSYAGWWENIECQHWAEVWPEDKNGYWDESWYPPSTFLDQLRNDMESLLTLRKQHALQPDEKDDALGEISDFLNKCSEQEQYETEFAYYELNSNDLFHDRFLSFLKKSVNELFPDKYQSWKLEIISPFFAKDPGNTKHRFFLEHLDGKVQEILMLLPKSQDGKALCEREYYCRIEKEESIYWAKWQPAIEENLGVTAQLWRPLHAKIYHFYNEEQSESWVFVGSVNFTQKAMGDNVEAGFFTRLEKAGPLLKCLGKKEKPEKPEDFDPPEEIALGDGPEDGNSIPQIYLGYDWKKNRLRGKTGELKGEDVFCIINIHLPEGEGRYAIKDWKINNEECHYEGNTEALENLLKNENGSWVRVSGKWKFDNAPKYQDFPCESREYRVSLQETGWGHKPQDMAPLSIRESVQEIQEILSFYADMNPMQDMKAVENAKNKELVSKGTAGKSLKTDDSHKMQQFLCNYAKVFRAFRGFEKKLRRDEKDENIEQIDYYLTGNAQNSLPTLINLLAKILRAGDLEEDDESHSNDSGQDPILFYLILLCCREIYEDDEFSKRPLVPKLLKEVSEHISEYKSKSSWKIFWLDGLKGDFVKVTNLSGV